MKKILLALLLAALPVAARAQVSEADTMIYEVNDPPQVSLTVQENGVDVGSESALNFLTSGGLCSDTPGSKVTCDLTGLGGGGSVATDAIWDAAGDLAVGTGANTAARLAKGNNGDVLTMTAGAVGWAAPAAAAGAVTLQGSSPGTPDTGNWNITGVGTSTHDNIHATLTPGLFLSNTQAALVGQQQEYSPSLKLCGAGWNTVGAASESDCWQIFDRPVAGNPTTNDLVFQTSIAGGAYAQKAYLSSGGKLTLGEATVSDGQITLSGATSGSITFTPDSGALGGKTITVPAKTGRMLVDVPTDDNVLVGSGTVWELKALPTCADSGGNHLNYDATTNTFSCGTTGDGTAAADPVTAGPSYFDDFCGVKSSATSSGGDLSGWSVNNNGTAAGQQSAAVVNGLAAHPCISSFTTGTGTGYTTLTRDDQGVLLNGSEHLEAMVYFPALSNATPGDTYTFWAGWNDQSLAGAVADGLYFTYSDSINSGKWQCTAANTEDGADTTADSGVSVAAATWYKLEIDTNSNATQATYKINGSTVCGSPITTDIPVTQTLNIAFVMDKTAGTTASTGVYWLDYAKWSLGAVSR